MARIKKFAPKENLTSFNTFVVDSGNNSDYFRITEFKDTFTGGKNGFLIEGSPYLKESTEIKMEILDVEGNPIYFEPGNGIPEYYEGVSKLIAVYVYNDTPIGTAKITILGELKEYVDDTGIVRQVPDEWNGVYNVKWEREFKVNKLLSNEDKVRFYRRPQVTIDEIVKPIFSGNPPTIIQTGSVNGLPLVPTENSNLSTFTLPTSYRLKVASGSGWTGSMENQTITFDGLSYSPRIDEVVNDTEIIVSPPYTENNIVKSFTDQDYSVSFIHLEGFSDLATALTGSFAKINISDMKTFVGDAARVKVYRRSQSNLTDYEFVQEIQLESNELLIDTETFNTKQENFGLFTQNTIDNYWVSSSSEITTSINQDFLYNSVKLDSIDSENTFFTSKSFDVREGVEYTLTFNVRKEENTNSNDYIDVFLGSTPGPVIEDVSNAISCSQQASYSGGESYPTVESINLGQNTGTTEFQHNGQNVPDRFIVEWDDNVVIDSGYVGNSSFYDFGGTSRNAFTSSLEGRIDPITQNTYPDLTTYTDDGYPRVISASSPLPAGSGSLSFNKTSEYPQLASVKVYAPMAGTAWDATLYCPLTPPDPNSVSRISNPTITQAITTVDSTNSVLQKTPIEVNFVADSIDDVRLYFEVTGSGWYISNLSLKASQETSFSPDVITFIQQVPKTLVTETFDYRFEFYDINNNFIPVKVEQTKTFTGGNTNLFNKSISVTPDSLYFAFDSASNPPNPVPPNVINFDVTTNLVTGSINYTSGAYDFAGNLLSASDYTGGQYPGLLSNLDVDNGRAPFLRVQDFTGSREDIVVQFIRYTAEVEGVSDNVIITRVEDGKGGVNHEILPYRGTVIKNKQSKTLEIQALRIDGTNRIELRSGLNRGFSDAKLHLLSSSLDGTETYVSLSQAITNPNFITGISAGTTGSGEIDYNAEFNRDSIENELTVYLMDGPTTESILTSLILTDLKDGLSNGTVTTTAEQFGINVKPTETTGYNPLNSVVTASFYRRGTTTNPLLASLVVYPSMSREPKTTLPHFYMFYETGAFDDNISVNVTDFAGNIIGSGVPGDGIPFYSAAETKQINFEFTYTEPVTSASVTANKSLFIVPDGLVGRDSIEINIDNVTLGSNAKGEVYNYGLANTNIQINQGDFFLINTASGDPGTFTTRSVTATNIDFTALEGNSSTTMSIGGFENMTALSASIVYDLDIYPYFTSSLITASRVQRFTKVVEGAGAIEVSLEPAVINFNADETGFIDSAIYQSATTDIIIKQDDDYLVYDATNSGTPGTYTASLVQSGISVGSVSSSNIDSNLTGDEVLHYKDFSGMTGVSASVDYNFIVYPYALKGGVAGKATNISRKQTFTKTSDGSSARKVTLTSTSNTVTYDGDGQQTSPEGAVQLTALATNVTSSNVYYTFVYTNTDETLAGPSTSNVYTIPASYLPATGSISNFRVDMRDGSTTKVIDDVDTISISGLGQGTNAYSAQLTNPASSVTVERDGTIYFDNAGTLIRAYKGGTELQYVEEYNENAFDPITFLPIGTFGQFSASIDSISAFLTQGTLRDGKSIVSSSGQLYASASAISNWTSPTDNIQGFITYKVDFENGRSTQFLTQNFSAVFEGATGPGIVVRGEWTGSVDYLFSLQQQRRDAVVYKYDNGGTEETHYFATTETLNDNKRTPYTASSGFTDAPFYDGTQEQGDVDAFGWEYLGEQDMFVAAKIAIFEESFVENTINVGKPTTSYDVNPQITIFGGDSEPFISVGQGTQGYGQLGIFMGVTEDGGPNGTAGTSGIMSLQDDTGTSYLRWDGYNLRVKSDDVLIETPDLTIDSQNELISIGQTTAEFTSSGIFLGNTPGGVPQLSLRGDTISGSYKSLEWNGEVLTVRGAIRQTEDGKIEPSLRGNWSAGNQYNEDDSVIYNGQTWSCNTIHTSTVSGVTGPPGSGDYWDSSSGTGKTVTLSAETFVITYDAQGNNPSPSGTVKLLASSSNFIDPYFKFTGGGATFSDEGTYTDGTADNDDASFTVPSTYFSTPLQFRVGVADGGLSGQDQSELVADVINVFAIQPGADSDPQYSLTPLNGTQIKNGTGALKVIVQSSDPTNGLQDVTTGDIKIYSGSNLITTYTGVTGTDYEAVIDAEAIVGTMELTLKSGSQVYDSLTLVDVTDGLGGGSFLTTNLKLTRTTSTNQFPVTNTYTPSYISATASFFDVQGDEYRQAFVISASYDSGTDTDYMSYEVSTNITDASITIVDVNDGDGTTYSGEGAANKLPTKDLNIVVSFTDSVSGQTSTIQETFYVVSDGLDGLDSIQVINTNQAHTLPATSDGVVTSHAGSGTILRVFEGANELSYDGVGTTAGTWKVDRYETPSSAITLGSITDDGDSITIADFSGMSNSEDSVVVKYAITGSRQSGGEFLTETTQTLTKAKEGVTAKQLSITADSQVYVFDDVDDTTPSQNNIEFTISQQNLSSTIPASAVTITPAVSSTFNPSSLSGTVTNGSGQQTFTLSYSGDLNNGKDDLPLTVSVTRDSITDTITIYKIEGGSDSLPQYFITPLDGTQIKNGSGTLTLQVQSSDPVNGLQTLSSGDIKIYSGSNLITNITGVTGTDYQPIISSEAIFGTMDLILSGSDGVLDSLTLLDVTDGLGGGTFLSPNLKTTRNPSNNTYTSSYLSATASFFSTDGTEYQKSVQITPSFVGGIDNMAVSTATGDSEITITAGDGDGGSITLGGSAVATKDTVLTAVFTDPTSRQTNTITETFYIISDGVDGSDGLTVILSNESHTIPASSAGAINPADYAGSGTTISLFEGTTQLEYDGVGTSNGTWTVSANGTNITPSTPSDVDNDASYGDHSNMTANTADIVYTITGKRLDGSSISITKTQSFSKSKAGVDGAGSFVTRLIADNVVISYDADGTNPTPSSITLIASASNFTDGYFKFTGGGSNFTDETSFTDGITANTDTASFTVPSNYSSTPYTFRLGVSDQNQLERATDTISIFSVKPGADSNPQYFITPENGTQIKNGSGTLTLHAQSSDPTNGLQDLSSGNIKIYSGSNLITTYAGVTGTDYNPTIAASAIVGTMNLTLFDGSTTYDSLTLLDVTDGLGGGTFLSPNLKTTRNPIDNSFTPTTLSATASFFDTSGTEYQKSVQITPTFSGGVDRMAVSNATGDSEITITAGDGDGGSITLGGSSAPTKDTVLTAVFTDPATGQTNTITETFYIISDGADGIDALTVINTNQSHTFPAGSDGVVSDYSNSGTDIKVFEGTASLSYDADGTSDGTWTVSSTQSPAATLTIGSITDNGNDITIGDHSSMSNSVNNVTITYTITGTRKNGTSFEIDTTQTITKAKDGATAKNLTVTSDSQVYVFDDADDNAAADDTIRIYINQQNLSGTVGTGDITITDASAGSITTPSLTGTVTDGTGEQYFDITFNTSSGDITSKTQLPVSILVQKDSITDSTSLNKLEGGASNAPMYFISPQNGTQIKNGTGALDFQILESAPGALNVVTSGNIKIYSGSNLITTYAGVTGTDYAPTIDATAIVGTMVLILKDGSTTYDSVQLLDVTDGLGGGSFISPNLKMTRQPNNSYLPSNTSLTASFYSTDGTEYTKAVGIYPNLDGGTDYMYYDNNTTQHNSTDISLTIDDGDGVVFSGTGIGNKLPTKDVVVTATFTDPKTGQTNTMVETVYIVSDGADGLDALTIILSNESHTLPAEADGTVTSFVGSGTDISLFEGTASILYDGVGTSDGTFTISANGTNITPGSISDLGDYASVADHSNMTEDSASITYTITGKRTGGGAISLSKQQSFVKAKAGISGSDGAPGPSGSDGVDGAIGEPAGIVYAGAWDITDATVQVPTVYLGEDDLKYVVGYQSGVSNYFVCAQTHRYKGEWSTAKVNLFDTAVDDVMDSGGTYYISIQATKGEGLWSSGTTYPQYSVVRYLAVPYVNLSGQVSSGGANPSANAAWTQYDITDAGQGLWTSIGSSIAPGTWTDGWESFGAEFTSVATDILFAQDVYANKTVNIGTGVNNNPVIAINADSASGYANPYISIGQVTQSFEQDGIFLGFSEGTASFSLLTDGAKANIGGLQVDKKGLFFEDSVVVGQDYIGSTTVSSSTYTFPSEVVNNGTITISGVGTDDIVSRDGDNEITTDTSRYFVNKTFTLTYYSGSYLNTSNGPFNPNQYAFERHGWRSDLTQDPEAAADETWDAGYVVNKSTIPNLTTNGDHAGVYSVIRLKNSATINSVFGISDSQVNSWKAESSGITIGQDESGQLFVRNTNTGRGPLSSIPLLYLRDSAGGGGPVFSSGSNAYKAFEIVDIINDSDAFLTTGYNSFVLGVEAWPNSPANNTSVFEDYMSAYEGNYTSLPESNIQIGGPGEDPNNSSPITQVVWEQPEIVQVNNPSGVVSAGSIGDVTQSIEAFRVHSSDTSAGKPYLSLGQLTQSYDEPGIFVGYSSGSSVEQLSLKSFDGTKYLKWTGTDIELSGTIEASAGSIAGLELKSGSIRDVNNNLIISADGTITGSGVNITKTLSGTDYPVLDTSKGIIDAKNNGRNLYFSSDESITSRSNTSTGTTPGTAHTIIWQGLKYETRVNVSLQMKVNKTAAGRAIGRVRGRLYYMNSGSSTTNDSHYDDWTLIRDKYIATVGNPVNSSAYSASLSQIGASSVDNQSKYFEIDDYDEGINSYNHEKHQTKILKLVLEPEAETILAGGGGIYVYLKNVSVNTGRGLASSFDTLLSDPQLPEPPF